MGRYRNLFEVVWSGVLLLIFITLPFSGIKAATVEELQKKKQQLQQEIDQSRKEAQEKKQEAQALSAQISDLDKGIDQIQNKINETQGQITQTQNEINQAQKEIDQKQRELEAEQANLRTTLVILYETANKSELQIVLGSNSLSEVVAYNQYIDVLEQKIEQTIADIERLKRELEEKKGELEGKKGELEQLRSQQIAYEQGLETEKSHKNRLLADTKADQKDLEEKIAESKQVYADVNSELYRLQEAARRRAQIQRGPRSTNTQFAWPTDFLYISTYFGGQTPFQNFHTGLDLVNVTGTPIFSSADGTVSTMTSVGYGYGRYVTASHANGLSSVYAHFLSFAPDLFVGKQVKQGDLLGYMDSTGWSTGSHLHFEIREDGVPVDPFLYLP